MVENTNGGGKQPPRKSFLYYYGLVMLIVMLLNIFLFPSMMDRTQEVRFDQFSEQLKENNVDEVYVTTNNEIVYTLKNDDKNKTWNVTYKTGEIPGVNLYELLDGKDVKYSSLDIVSVVIAIVSPGFNMNISRSSFKQASRTSYSNITPSQ